MATVEREVKSGIPLDQLVHELNGVVSAVCADFPVRHSLSDVGNDRFRKRLVIARRIFVRMSLKKNSVYTREVAWVCQK